MNASAVWDQGSVRRGRAGAGAGWPDLQHLDARSPDRRAPAAYQRAHRQSLAGAAAERHRAAGGVRELLQGGIRSTYDRCERATATTDFHRLRRAGTCRRFSGAADAHARHPEPGKETGIRPVVRREPSSRQRGRHERGPALRGYRCLLHRHPRRAPDRPAGGVDFTVSDDGGFLCDQARRLQWAAQGFSQTQFFFGQAGAFFDPAFAPIINRDLAQATRTVRGASAFGIYPLSRFSRVEFSGAVARFSEEFRNPELDEFSRGFQQDRFGQALLRNGTFVPFSVAFVQETTVFREFGPLAGRTMRLAYDGAPKIGNSLSRQTVEADVRKYQRLAGSSLLALRARGFRSWGQAPDFLFFGGNSEMRGYQFLEFIGQNAFFGNAELRFPLIHAMATPIGILGGIRGVFFFNIGAAWFDDTGFKFTSSRDDIVQPFLGLRATAPEFVEPVLGPPTQVSGFRLVDGRASYGVGLETFALGFPIHFDWSWRTLFNREWEDVLFASQGGSSAFRKPRFDVWIGFNF